jgi:hypothetical protein
MIDSWAPIRDLQRRAARAAALDAPPDIHPGVLLRYDIIQLAHALGLN